jgi:hypothetical protein
LPPYNRPVHNESNQNAEIGSLHTNRITNASLSAMIEIFDLSVIAKVSLGAWLRSATSSLSRTEAATCIQKLKHNQQNEIIENIVRMSWCIVIDQVIVWFLLITCIVSGIMSKPNLPE